MKKLFFLLLLTGLCAGPLLAQPPKPELSMRQGPPPHERPEGHLQHHKPAPLQLRDLDRLVQELELKPEQVESLRSILFESGRERLTREGNIRVLEFTMQAMLMEETPNTQELRELHEEIYQEKSRMAWQHVETELRLKTVLTTEQQRKLRSRKPRAPRPHFDRGRPGMEGPPGKRP